MRAWSEPILPSPEMRPLLYDPDEVRGSHARELADTEQRHVWAFLGDGETDEPESLGAISLAARAQLDNLVFVINCNLQRLDGPVRGNASIVKELEAAFRGAGWNRSNRVHRG